MQIQQCLSDRAALAFCLAVLLAAGAATAEVCNLKLVTDASPDYSDLPSFLHSATARWGSPQEKCWALFYWNHIGRRQTAPMMLHGLELTDPIRQFNDYGYTMCSTISGVNCALWHNLGLPVRFWDISLHTVPEVFYGGRWHMYDNSMSALYTLCDGAGIIISIGTTAIVISSTSRRTSPTPGYQGTIYPAVAGEDAWLVYRLDAPADITRVNYGGRFYNRAPRSHVDLLYSLDAGRTWRKSWSLRRTAPPWDVIHYETLELPGGHRSVWLKYLMNTTEAAPAGCSIYAVRMEAAYLPLDTAFRPLEVTFNWSERQKDRTLVERSHRQTVPRLPFRYTINVGGEDHPVITLDLGTPAPCASFAMNLHGYPWWDSLKGEVRDRVEVLTSLDGQEYRSQGFLKLNFFWKDLPANYMWTDEETMTSGTFRLIPDRPVTTRFVQYRIANKRFFDCAGLEVLDAIGSAPFDLRIALPDEAGPAVSLAPADDGSEPSRSSFRKDKP